MASGTNSEVARSRIILRVLANVARKFQKTCSVSHLLNRVDNLTNSNKLNIIVEVIKFI